MNAIVYRMKSRKDQKSWRPRSLVDMRGPRFPEEYQEIASRDVESIKSFLDDPSMQLGDLIFFGEGEDMEAYVIAPFGSELVKFGREWKSPE